MVGRYLQTVLGHTTDVAGIAALTHLSSTGAPVSDGVIGAIVTIAIGQRYAKAKWGTYQYGESSNGEQQQ